MRRWEQSYPRMDTKEKRKGVSTEPTAVRTHPSVSSLFLHPCPFVLFVDNSFRSFHLRPSAFIGGFKAFLRGLCVSAVGCCWNGYIRMSYLPGFSTGSVPSSIMSFRGDSCVRSG